MHLWRKPGRLACTLAMMALPAAGTADACTRAVHLGPQGNVITARSMDWKSDIVSNLWILPRGIERSGQAGPNSIRWTSRYGSVVVSGYDVSSTDGVNEKGLSAIIEYIGGKQVTHHGRQYQAMTNSPTFDQQLALNTYWRGIGGTTVLPGTNRAADRFARASFYINAIPKFDDPNKALAAVSSVIHNTSVPYGINTPEEPNISPTRWRTVFDHRRGLYFFESALTPDTFWVDLRKIDFSKETGKTMVLDLGPNQDHTFSGEANDKFVERKAFRSLGLSG